MTKTFTFDIYITEPSIDFDEAAEKLYEACNDISWSSSNGQHCVGFDRDGNSLAETVSSAIEDIEKANIGTEIICINIYKD